MFVVVRCVRVARFVLSLLLALFGALCARMCVAHGLAETGVGVVFKCVWWAWVVWARVYIMFFQVCGIYLTVFFNPSNLYWEDVCKSKVCFHPLQPTQPIQPVLGGCMQVQGMLPKSNTYGRMCASPRYVIIPPPPHPPTPPNLSKWNPYGSMYASPRYVIIPPNSPHPPNPPNPSNLYWEDVCKSKVCYHPPPPSPSNLSKSNPYGRMCASPRYVIIPPPPTQPIQPIQTESVW